MSSAPNSGSLAMVRAVPIPRLFEPLANCISRLQFEAVDIREVIGSIALSVRLRMIPFNSVAHIGYLGEGRDHVAMR